MNLFFEMVRKVALCTESMSMFGFYQPRKSDK